MTSPRKTILVVDDEPDILAYLAVIFEDNGFETVPAADGTEALILARSATPDLITLDITMPGKSGLRTYRDIKDDPQLAAIPVVIITAAENTMEGFLQMLGDEAEPEGFLNKPINVEALLDIAESILAG